MTSNTLASFLSKLLRPDRKANPSTSVRADLRKRHSAPVPSWFDVNDPTHIPPPALAVVQTKPKKNQRGNGIEEIPQDHSSPHPSKRQNIRNNSNINNNNSNSSSNKKQQKKKKKPQKNQKPEAAIVKRPPALDVEETNKENRGKDRPTRADKAARRHSSGLAYWFCVSANADTLERGMKAPLPRDKDNKNGKNKQRLGSIPEQSQPGTDRCKPGKPVSLAGVIRRDGKKRKGDPKNRHSAPPDTFAVFRAKDRPTTPNQFQGIFTHQGEQPTAVPGRVRSKAAPSPTRSISPGVRYRVDGTLERPYVFPSGLTFGAEGRKIQLRSSSASPISESPTHPFTNPAMTTSTVLADVHDATKKVSRDPTKPGEQPYYCSSNPNVADVSYDDFDIRKAFYLKYDSDHSAHQHHDTSRPDASRKNNRHSMPIFPENLNACSHNRGGTVLHQECTQPTSIAEEDVCKTSDGHLPSPSNISGRPNRYSMPPTNEEFVYMGSRENLNVWSDFVEDQRLANAKNCELDQEGVTMAAAATKRRYSSPVHNTDYVYMGSIENIHLLNAGDKRAGVLSLKRDVDAFFLTGSGAMPTEQAMSLQNQDPGIRGSSLSEADEAGAHQAAPQNVSTLSDGAQNHFQKQNNLGHALAKEEPGDFDEIHHSLPELSLPRGQNLARATVSESNALYSDDDDDSSDDNDDDCLTDNAGKKNTAPKVRHNPFSRNLGRASCMPGNKRFFAPPPAIFSQSDSTVNTSGTKESSAKYMAATQKFTFLPGNKRFHLPPPPNYTPPREEMEDAHACLTQMAACEKGSQTNLNDEALYCVDMEDRDLSLPRSNAKTIRSSVSATEEVPTRKDMVNANKASNSDIHKDHEQCHKFQQQARGRKLLNVSTTSSQGSDDVFKDGTGSDSMTWTAERLKLPSPRNGKYSLAGVAPRNYQRNINAGATASKTCIETKQSSLLPCKDNATFKDNSHHVHSNSSTPLNAAKMDVKSVELVASKNETFVAIENINAVVTSTPKVVRREKPEHPQGGEDRPVPTPRKRYSALDFCGYSSSSPSSSTTKGENPNSRGGDHPTSRTSSYPEEGLDKKQQCHATAMVKAPPVPRKRTNLSKSLGGSDSCSAAEDSGKPSLHNGTSVDPKVAVAQRNTITSNDDSKHSVRGISDESTKRSAVDASPSATTTSSSCAQTNHSHNHPRFHHRTLTTTITSTTTPTSSNNNFNGTSINVNRRRQNKGVSFDDTCIADDEMSCVDEDFRNADSSEVDESSRDTTMKRRRRSMRKCVSVDDLLRSGSILDRSLILARKRRRRMRERKCRSQLLLSSSDDEAEQAGPVGDRHSWRKAWTSQGNSIRADPLDDHTSAVRPSSLTENLIDASLPFTAHHRTGEGKPVRSGKHDHPGQTSGPNPSLDSRFAHHPRPWEIGLKNMPTKQKSPGKAVVCAGNNGKPFGEGCKQNFAEGGGRDLASSSSSPHRLGKAISSSTSRLERGVKKAGVETVV